MKKRRLRIGILTHNYPNNSKERKDAGVFIYDFAHELSKYASVFILCSNYGGKKEIDKKVPVTWFDWGGPKNKFGDWKLFSPMSVFYFFKLFIVGSKKALRFTKENEIDYVLAAWSLPSSFYAFIVKRSLGVPYGVWDLGSDVNMYAKIPILRQIIVYCHKKANNVFPNSINLQKSVYELTKIKGDILSPVTRIPKTGIKLVKLDHKYFNFLFVGRLEKVKGIDLLIEGCNLLKDKNLKFRVNVLGDGTMKDEINNKIKDYGLDEYVVMHGYADGDKVFGYMKASDCLIIPSRNESGPIVAVEGAKLGLPFVAANVGHCPRLVKKYNIGRIFKKGNINSMVHEMAIVMKKTEIRKLSKGRFKEVADDFSQEKVVKIFLSKMKLK